MTVTATPIAIERLCDDACELTLAGELDLHDTPALAAAFDEVEALGARRVLVDLCAVPFVDSTILGVLVAASRRFETLVLAVGDLRVLRVLEVTGLDRKLLVERSRSEALALLTERRSR